MGRRVESSEDKRRGGGEVGREGKDRQIREDRGEGEANTHHISLQGEFDTRMSRKATPPKGKSVSRIAESLEENRLSV